MTTAPLSPAALRDLVRATAADGLSVSAAAIGTTPDRLFAALARAICSSAPPRPCLPNVWKCSTDGCGRIAMMSRADFTSDRRDEIGRTIRCSECSGEDERARSERRRHDADRLARENAELADYVQTRGLDDVAAELGLDPAVLAQAVGLPVPA